MVHCSTSVSRKPSAADPATTSAAAASCGISHVFPKGDNKSKRTNNPSTGRKLVTAAINVPCGANTISLCPKHLSTQEQQHRRKMVVKQTEDLAAEALKPPSSTSPKEQAAAAAAVAPNDSYVTPSRALVPPGLNVEADFDRNPTDLYLKLYRKDWEAAVLRTKKYPYEACIWITRKEVDGGLRWRLLPIHCAVIYRAPEKVILALLFAFPEGAKSKDDQGNLPLHLAYRVGSNENIVRVLLWAYPESVEATDSEGRTPKVLAQTYKSNFTGAFLRILESQSGAATTTKVETVAEEPEPAPAVTKVEPKAEPIAKVEQQQHPAVQTPVVAAKAEPPSPVKVEAPLSPAVEEPQLELETRDDTGATGAATATTTQEGSFVNSNYQSINKEEVCHDPISDHRLMMEKDLSEAEYTANDNNARQPTDTEPVAAPDKITEASGPPMSVEEKRIVSPVAVPPEGDEKNNSIADPPLHSEEEKPIADPTPSVPEAAVAAPPKTTPASIAGGYTPALTVDTNIAAVTSNNSAKESSPRPWSPTTEAEFLKEEAMNHVRFMASISGSNDTNDVSKTVAAIMARSSLSPSADQQQQQQQQQQRALSPTAIVRNLSSPVPPEAAASADLGGIIGKDDHQQQNQQQPQQQQQQQHRDPYDELIAEMKIELQKEIQAFDDETEENLRPLQEQVDSLRKNLTKNQESSQVLADHAISLEGQLDSRGETERYLATRIAKLDSELKAIARMKDSSEVTLKKSIESHNEDKKSLLRMVDFLRKQNAEEARALDGIFKTTEHKKKQLEVEVGRLNKKIKILQQDCDCVRSDAEILESQLKKRIENESALALQATTLSSKLAATGKDSNLQTASFSARMRVMMRERNDLRVTANHLTDKLNVVLGRMEAMAEKQEGLKERAEENREEWTRAASNQAKVLSSTRELDAYVTERSEHDAIVEFAKKLDDLKEKTRKERELIADVLNWKKTTADSEDEEEDPLLGLDEHAERLESGSQKQREFAKNANDLHAELSSMIDEVNDELKKELPERVDIEAENPPAGGAELSSALDKEIDVDTIIAEVASVLSKDVDSKQDADKKASSTEYVSQLMMGRRAAEISQHDEEKIVATSFSQECTLQEFETKLSVDSTLANSSTISSPPPSDCSTKKKVSFSESLVEEHIVEKVNVQQPKVAAAVLEMEPAEGDEEQRDDSEGTELVVVEGEAAAAAAKPVEDEGDGIEINMAKLYEILGRVEELRDDPEEKKVLQAVKAAVVKQKFKKGLSSPGGGGGGGGHDHL